MSDAETEAKLSEIDRQLVWQGFKQMMPLAAFVVVFGAAFGLAAVQVGLDNPLIFFMSATVFAGVAQFAVLDLWGAHLPIITLAMTVFAINARHLLMGATLYPWLRHMPTTRRYGVMVLASDANWAMTMQALARGQAGFGLLLGGGLALWLSWVLGTVLGTYFGGAFQDPRRYGMDMVMGCFLLAMVADGPKNSRMLVIWGVAATSSLLAHRYLANNSHVVVGALAGGLVGAIWTEEKDDEH
ncbi:AzlC family ABC transporter permease [Methylibium sp.]|uniref:AzlC family ABC transporter permease n=1 Tax=Methylibium sp. TaxID=2067992 RepID=UPI00333F075E